MTLTFYWQIDAPAPYSIEKECGRKRVRSAGDQQQDRFAQRTKSDPHGRNAIHFCNDYKLQNIASYLHSILQDGGEILT